MRPGVRRLLYWTPRAIMILSPSSSASLHSMCSKGLRVLGTLGALLMHLIPTGLVLIALAIAWRWNGWEDSSSSGWASPTW